MKATFSPPPFPSAAAPEVHCHRCGGCGFLALDEDAATRPALCIDCHEQAGTSQAAAGHCCTDSCALPTDHTGLCQP